MRKINRIGLVINKEVNIDYMKDNIEDINIIRKDEMNFYMGKYKNLEVVFTVITDMDNGAQDCAEVIIDSLDADGIISMGIGGSLTDNIRICDIVISYDVIKGSLSEINKENQEGQIVSDGFFRRMAIDAYDKIALKAWNYHLGRIVTTDFFVADRKFRDDLYAKYKGHCVANDVAMVGEVAKRKNVPFISICAISNNSKGNAYVECKELSMISAYNVSTYLLKVLDEINEEAIRIV